MKYLLLGAILFFSGIYIGLQFEKEQTGIGTGTDLGATILEVQNELDVKTEELNVKTVELDTLKDKVLEGKESAMNLYLDYYFSMFQQTSVEYIDPKGVTYIITKK